MIITEQPPDERIESIIGRSGLWAVLAFHTNYSRQYREVAARRADRERAMGSFQPLTATHVNLGRQVAKDDAECARLALLIAQCEGRIVGDFGAVVTAVEDQAF